ncbi:MAG TPA: T9SS type A sorting domain-containing protein [Chitinophagales bacterium]|nr:T9SS type A sorting domain-containing protein [Chitinophagales bacterium]
MKLLLPFIFLFFCLSVNVFAQCNPAVPFNAVVVNSTQTINGGFDPIWVCSGDTLHSDGGFHKTFLEPGAVMTTSGGIDTIYVKGSAKFFMNGGIHVIYYENLADLSIAGGIPTLSACAAIAFNYDDAPANGCALLLSAAFQSTDSSVCTGECISFSSLSSNATSWEWFFPGATPSSSTVEDPSSICYNDPGTYDVTLIVGNSNESDTITLLNFISASPPPSTPALTQSSDTLFSTQGYATYQWYFEGTLINGATSYFYVASQNGNYSVVVTSNKGCGNATASIDFVFTGLHERFHSTTSCNVFPNPANAFFMLQINSGSGSIVEVSVTDYLGRIMDKIRLPIHPGNNEFKFEAGNLPAGVYVLKCNAGTELFNEKIIVLH